MTLSLVIPCYNEEGNVERFFSEARSAFCKSEEKIEYIFVDDGSSDNTLLNLKKIYNENPEEDVQILSFSRNFGKEAAMYAGLSNASGDCVCIIDADLQQKPQVVLEMLDILNQNDDIDCVAAYQDVRNEGKMMSFAKSAFYKIINKLSDVEFVCGASDFRLMRKSMVNAVLSMTETNRFSKGIFGFVGFKTQYIPYTVAQRESGKSKWNFQKLMSYAIDGIIAFSTVPLKFALWAGALSFIAGIICIILACVCGADIFTPALTTVLAFLLSGIILTSIGILSAYVKRAYIEIKNRPVYIIKTYLRREK